MLHRFARRFSLAALTLLLVSSGLCAVESDPIQPDAQTAHLPVPDPASRLATEKHIREVFASEYAAGNTAQGKAQLAAALSREAANPGNNPTTRFVLLSEARDNAASGGDFAAACSAVDALARSFDVQPLDMKLAILQHARAGTLTPKAAGNAVDEAMRLAGDAVASDKYEVALTAAQLAETFAVATKNASVLSAVRGGGSEVRRVHDAYVRLKPAIQRLTTDPDNADASMTVGKFFCFEKQDWKKGLPLLAHGADAKLQAIARRDTEKPVTATGREQLANDWWATAEHEQPAVKAAMQCRAAYWYGEALSGLSGLNKTAAEKRIAAAAKAAGSAKPWLAHEAAPGGLILTPVAAFDGRFETVDDGGVKLFRGMVTPEGKYDANIYFTAADHAGELHGPSYLWLIYQDLGHGTLVVEYNSDNGDYKRAAATTSVSLTDDGRTKMAVFKLDTPNFRHAQNSGADLRVMGPGGKTPTCIERATLYPQPPSP